MNKCKRIRKYLPGFIEGEIEANLKLDIERHLRACPDCRKEKELLARSWAILESWPAVEPSPNFKARFWQEVEALEHRREKISWPYLFKWRLAPVLAVVSILILTASLFLKVRTERINLVKEMELCQDLELIENMDLLLEWENIEDGGQDEIT